MDNIMRVLQVREQSICGRNYKVKFSVVSVLFGFFDRPN